MKKLITLLGVSTLFGCGGGTIVPYKAIAHASKVCDTSGGTELVYVYTGFNSYTFNRYTAKCKNGFRITVDVEDIL